MLKSWPEISEPLPIDSTTETSASTWLAMPRIQPHGSARVYSR
jgi:hypothetical protein